MRRGAGWVERRRAEDLGGSGGLRDLTDAGEVIGGNASLTLARDGHLYFGLAGGVGLSTTVVGFSAVAGQMTTAESPKMIGTASSR